MDTLKEKLRVLFLSLFADLPISPDYVLEETWKIIVDHFKALYSK